MHSDARISDIRRRLMDTDFTKRNPLHAAELDLERKVLENEARQKNGEPPRYTAHWY